MRSRLVAAVLAVFAASAAAQYESVVELKNVSGEVKTDWPVVLRVYTVLGRNLDPARLKAEGLHVFGPDGQELDCYVEAIPPHDQVGNDELMFLIPRIEPGQVLTYRIVADDRLVTRRRKPDLVGSPHNLLANGGFEQGNEKGPAGFEGDGRQDTQVKHTGRASLALSADNATVVARFAKGLPLRKGSPYYFGFWSKTDNVSRFGYQAGNGAHVRLSGFNPTDPKGPPTRQPDIPAQCHTRDWLKVTFEYRGHTDWGMDLYTAPAMAAEAALEFVLPQRRHYYMEPGKTLGRWWVDDAVLMEQPETTVRFDQAVGKRATDGVFLFTRPSNSYPGRFIVPDGRWRGEENNWNDPLPWCNFPYAHEKLDRLDRWAMKGQRATFCLGLYHVRALGEVSCRLREDALQIAPRGSGGLESPRLPAGAITDLPVELIEYCPGLASEDKDRYLDVLYEQGNKDLQNVAVRPAGKAGVRLFFLTFRVPRQAKPGTYSGVVELTEGGKALAAVPIRLRVQDLEQPVIKDTYVGLIHQAGSSVPASDEMLKVYGRSGFTSIAWFGRFLSYKQGEDGRMHVDEAGVEKQMKRVMAADITAGVCLYSDVQLDRKPNNRPGVMHRMAIEEAASRAGTTEKEAYARLIKEADAIWKKHPEWPTLIHMNWDEPPPVNERMGWTREILPDALVTLDTQFNPLAQCAKHYNMPAFDNPADWSGPELYRWVKKVSGDFGYCGQPASAEWSRYQGGMLMVTTAARYFHGWHLENANAQIHPGPTKGSVLRAVSMICWAEALDDLKCHRLLTTEMEKASRGSTVAKAAAAASQRYLDRAFATWNGDHKKRWPIEPYLGQAADWGYERFYDDWQEQMARHAARIKGLAWIE